MILVQELSKQLHFIDHHFRQTGTASHDSYLLQWRYVQVIDSNRWPECVASSSSSFLSSSFFLNTIVIFFFFFFLLLHTLRYLTTFLITQRHFCVSTNLTVYYLSGAHSPVLKGLCDPRLRCVVFTMFSCDIIFFSAFHNRLPALAF
jgi:hypothetical protein